MTTDTRQVPNPIPKISDYIRRKSEGYLSRRRSDDYRQQRHQQEITDGRTYASRHQHTTAPIHITTVKEEQENASNLRSNLSRKQLLNEDDDFL